MKSVTVTYHRSYNYGATLQAYALQKTILSLGIDNRILDFTRPWPQNSIIFSKGVRRFLVSFVLYFFGMLREKEIEKLYRSFDVFTKNNLLLTLKFDSIEALNNNLPDADFYITGSDQVFTLRDKSFWVKLHMLDFGDDKIKRYSYAASLAEYNYNESEKQQFSAYLNNFNGISLRENKAVKYLGSFVKKNLLQHIDPVFLLSKKQWYKLAIKPEVKSKYILYFQVNSNSLAQKVVDYLKKKYNLPVVCIQTNPVIRIMADKTIISAGPQEFLGWVMDAEMVVTTSFHGLAFSLIFEKEFYLLTKESSNPIRMQELLSLLHLENRLIREKEDIDKVTLIDFKQIKYIIDEQRNKSINYLESIIKENKHDM